MIKKYSTVIKHLAEEKYHDAMQGAYLPKFEGADIVAFIYGVPVKKVYRDVDKEYKKK